MTFLPSKLFLPTVVACGAVLVTLAGCGTGIGTSVESTPIQGAALQGKIYGGQQPVSGSTIQLYAVGTTGYGTGATALLATAVTSNGSGNFSITGTYTCPSASTQVYITATGGNAGGGNNSALAMMAGLGNCGNLTPSSFLFINEITTVASVWALSPFMQGNAIGAPATNQSGLALAFTDIAQIANNASGVTPGPALPTGAVAPVAEINSLADMIASCVNSSGSTSTPCAMLFSATTVNGTAPSDTITAAVNIAHNPGQNVPALLALVSPIAPFQPTLASATDFTLGVTYPVGTVPVALSVDAADNIWVANRGTGSNSSSVSKVSHAGVASTFTGGGISLPSGIAIDTVGNVWVVNSTNSLTELTNAGSPVSGSPFTGGGLSQPTSIAIDGVGQVWVANSGTKTMSLFSTSGTALSSSSGIPASAVDGGGLTGIAISPR